MLQTLWQSSSKLVNHLRHISSMDFLRHSYFGVSGSNHDRLAYSFTIKSRGQKNEKVPLSVKKQLVGSCVWHDIHLQQFFYFKDEKTSLEKLRGFQKATQYRHSRTRMRRYNSRAKKVQKNRGQCLSTCALKLGCLGPVSILCLSLLMCSMGISIVQSSLSCRQLNM